MVGTKAGSPPTLVANNIALLAVFLALNLFALTEAIPLLASQYAAEGLLFGDSELVLFDWGKQ